MEVILCKSIFSRGLLLRKPKHRQLLTSEEKRGMRKKRQLFVVHGCGTPKTQVFFSKICKLQQKVCICGENQRGKSSGQTSKLNEATLTARGLCVSIAFLILKQKWNVSGFAQKMQEDKDILWEIIGSCPLFCAHYLSSLSWDLSFGTEIRQKGSLCADKGIVFVLSRIRDNLNNNGVICVVFPRDHSCTILFLSTHLQK